MSAIRALSRHARSLSRMTTPAKPTATRSFHSPFVVLASSPLEAPPSPTSNVSPLYEKQLDHSPDPQLSSAGTRTYVVSEPDPANTPYEVPSGAFPTTAPYQPFAPTEPPPSRPRASTSPSFAHPLTRAVPQNEAGVSESAAVRYRQAPGELHQRGGSYGGLGLMDEASTHKGQGDLASRNPQPDDPKIAEKYSSLGVDNAWKERK